MASCMRIKLVCRVSVLVVDVMVVPNWTSSDGEFMCSKSDQLWKEMCVYGCNHSSALEYFLVNQHNNHDVISYESKILLQNCLGFPNFRDLYLQPLNL